MCHLYVTFQQCKSFNHHLEPYFSVVFFHGRGLIFWIYVSVGNPSEISGLKSCCCLIIVYFVQEFGTGCEKKTWIHLSLQMINSGNIETVIGQIRGLGRKLLWKSLGFKNDWYIWCLRPCIVVGMGFPWYIASQPLMSTVPPQFNPEWSVGSH